MSKNKIYKYFCCTLHTARCTLLACGAWLLACSFLFAQDGFKYDAKGRRNPFIPLLTSDGRLLKLDKLDTGEERGSLLIEGIIYDEHALSYAIVNGQVVKVGDWVGDYQVLKIKKNKIVFIKHGQTLELELKKEAGE